MSELRMARVVALEEREARELALARAAPEGSRRRRRHERRARDAHEAWTHLYARELAATRSSWLVSVPVREVGDRPLTDVYPMEDPE